MLRYAVFAVGMVLLAGIGLMVWVRFAPVTVLDWHTSRWMPLHLGEVDTRFTDGTCADGVSVYDNGANSLCPAVGTPQEVLSKLDAIAMATPRTRRIAGSPDDGLITWETRSLIFGFPDYTTAQTQTIDGTTQIFVQARARFGSSDMGVNGARLKAWLTQIPLRYPTNP